jgi:hypothetical protein
MSAHNNLAAMNCTANCVVDGRRFIKTFFLATAAGEDDATTMGRALRRAREILSYQHGVTDESVLVERVTYG